MVLFYVPAAARNRALNGISAAGQQAFFSAMYTATMAKYPGRCRLVPPHITAHSDSRYSNEADPHQVRLVELQQTDAYI